MSKNQVYSFNPETIELLLLFLLTSILLEIFFT